MASREQSVLGYIYLFLGLVAVDAAIEMGLVTSMVAFLHVRGTGPFEVDYPAGQTFELFGVPQNLLVNQGHTSNGAGGTALVLVGFGGIIALCMQHFSRKKSARTSPVFYLWAVIVILSFLLTLTALIYVNVVTHATSNQTIDLAVASSNAFPAIYPQDQWTPETWYAAVLDLPLHSASDRQLITKYLHIIRGWRYNLIALFILGFVLAGLVVLELLRARRTSRGMYGSTTTTLMGQEAAFGNNAYKGFR